MVAIDDNYMQEAYDEGLRDPRATELVERYARRRMTVSTAAATGSVVAAFALGALTAVSILALSRRD